MGKGIGKLQKSMDFNLAIVFAVQGSAFCGQMRYHAEDCQKV
jgi:hypothetical protein